MTGYLLVRLAAGECWNFIAFANNLVPWWALGALIACGVAIFSRFRWVLIALQLPILGAFLILYGAMYNPARTSAQDHTGFEISAATYNLSAGFSQPRPVVDVLKSLDTALIGVQELGRGRAITLRQQLSDQYPYQVFYLAPQYQGLGLLSQYPVLEHYVKRSRVGYLRYLRVVVDVSGMPVAVYVVNPSAPDNHSWPLTYNDDNREDVINSLLIRLEMETYPVLILCDCNLTDQSDDYRKMDRVLDDAFRQAGWGMGFTFPVASDSVILPLPPVVRLDYIWYSAPFVAVKAYVVNDTGTSDHRPVVARLVVPAAEAGD